MSNDDHDIPAERELPLEEIGHPETRYDRSDLSARGIVGFLIGLALTIVFIHIIIWGFLRYFSQDTIQPVPRTAALITPPNQMGKLGDPVQRFPAPQLQPDPVADLNKYRATVEEQLNTYGWVDQNTGVARIPVERAIDLVAKQGLPTRQAPALAPRASFGSGDGSVAGAGAGTEPRGNQ